MKRKRGIFIFLNLFILIANLILASDNLKQGIEAYNQGKFNEAIRLINQAFKDNLTTDEKKEANKYIALSQIALGNMNAARDTFTELLLLDPNYKLEEDEVSPKVYQFFLQVKEEKKDIIIAKLADNNYLLAKAYANKENFDKAFEKIEAAIKLQPREEKYLNYKKELEKAKEKWEEKKKLEKKLANMVIVEGGKTIVGYAKTRREVEVSTFYMDKYLVSNRDYSYFLEENKRKPPKDWVGGSYPLGKADHPVVYVSHEDALEYCKWKGKRLATVEEWERAARGSDGLIYPFGSSFSRGICNTAESNIKDTSQVHKHKQCVSPYGIYDMAGNVWEWTSSIENGKYILKGGSFKDGADKAVTYANRKENGSKMDKNIGFRCVLTLEENEKSK